MDSALRADAAAERSSTTSVRGGGGVLRRGSQPALHAVLTFLSCGLWLPSWILAAIFGGGRGSTAVVTGGAGASAGTPSRLNHKPLMIGGAIFLGLMVLGTAAQHPWVFIPLVLLAGAGGALFWKYKTAKDREELELREQYRRDVIADRADYEDKLYYEGDPRVRRVKYSPGSSCPGAVIS